MSKESEAAARKGWQNLQTAALGQGISVQAFKQWGVEPVQRGEREVYYLPADITRNRVEHALAKAAKARPEPETADYEGERREKTALVRAQREGQELKNAQTRRELAPLRMISWTLSKVGTQISAILGAIPLKVKNVVPKLSAGEIELIRREIVKAQNIAAAVTVDPDEYERILGADGSQRRPSDA